MWPRSKSMATKKRYLQKRTPKKRDRTFLKRDVQHRTKILGLAEGLGAPPGRPAGRPAERPAERPTCRRVDALSRPV